MVKEKAAEEAPTKSSSINPLWTSCLYTQRDTRKSPFKDDMLLSTSEFARLPTNNLEHPFRVPSSIVHTYHVKSIRSDGPYIIALLSRLGCSRCHRNPDRSYFIDSQYSATAYLFACLLLLLTGMPSRFETIQPPRQGEINGASSRPMNQSINQSGFTVL
ncbi:hypothetical protein B0T20DRAFT_237549 [Sordaria brevicollis]|uniref:Uncharacterized protein n=1 Tax=Sordaria brevicollis TaxID=83679 RepID=A0AAE0PDG8_SORBR|nr:hypothetical protein B0T20DRAFT_237549 [Sordaria brevicollis]